jgi:hypothetical protein
MMKLRHVLPLLLTVLVGPAVSGCLHASAKTVSDSPPLDTPPAPPRVIEVVEVTPPAPVPLVEEPPRQPIRPPARTQPPRAEAPPPRVQEPPKVEVSEPPPAVVEAPPSRPPATLQTTPAGTEGEVERVIRGVITRAKENLGRVNYRNLNADAKSQYDTAKRFLEQSEEALRPPQNLVFARNLADKASALAAQLAGR